MFASITVAALSPRLPLGRAALLLAASLLLHAAVLTMLRDRLHEPAREGVTRSRTIDAALIFERPASPPPRALPAPRPRPKPRPAPPPSASQSATAAAPVAPDALPLHDETASGEVAPPESAPPAEPPPAETPPAVEQGARPAAADLALELAEIGGARDSLPVAATYAYRMFDSRYPSFSGQTTVEWRFDVAAQRYETRLRTTVFDVPIAEITSAGAVQGFGLAPERYVQKTATRAAVAVNIDWSRRVVTFSRRSDERPAREGIQDRLSFQFQLMALGQNLPDAFTPGATISMQVAAPNDVETYDFVVVGRETLALDAGSIDTVKLDRPKSAGADSRVEVWLAPARRWLPVMLRFTDRRGNVTESRLESAHEGGG